MSYHTTIIENLKIEYVKKGEGKDLLFLHGGSVSYRTSMIFLNEASKYFKVWAFSFPGAGRSSSLPKEWRFEDYIKIVKRFCESQNIKPIVCGHSVGGAIALKTINAYPYLFRNTVLFAPAGLGQSDAKKVVRIVIKNQLKNLIIKGKSIRNDILVNLIYHTKDLFKISKIFEGINIREDVMILRKNDAVFLGRNDELFPSSNIDFFSRINGVRIFLFNGGHDLLNQKHKKICKLLYNMYS